MTETADVKRGPGWWTTRHRYLLTRGTAFFEPTLPESEPFRAAVAGLGDGRGGYPLRPDVACSSSTLRTVTGQAVDYPARVNVDYPDKLDRLTTLLRVPCAIPILIILALITASGAATSSHDSGNSETHGGLAAGLAIATALMIVFRRKYPRWWFDFVRELARFGGRVFAYLSLLTDRYPSTDDEQGVHVEIDYPNAEVDLNRWLPLVKWVLAIPHVFPLALLWILTIPVLVGAWVAILLTGNYPRTLFDFVVGVFRWSLRVSAYALLLVTDRYPPFSLR